MQDTEDSADERAERTGGFNVCVAPSYCRDPDFRSRVQTKSAETERSAEDSCPETLIIRLRKYRDSTEVYIQITESGIEL